MYATPPLASAKEVAVEARRCSGRRRDLDRSFSAGSWFIEISR